MSDRGGRGRLWRARCTPDPDARRVGLCDTADPSLLTHPGQSSPGTTGAHLRPPESTYDLLRMHHGILLDFDQGAERLVVPQRMGVPRRGAQISWPPVRSAGGRQRASSWPPHAQFLMDADSSSAGQSMSAVCKAEASSELSCLCSYLQDSYSLGSQLQSGGGRKGGTMHATGIDQLTGYAIIDSVKYRVKRVLGKRG